MIGPMDPIVTYTLFLLCHKMGPLVEHQFYARFHDGKSNSVSPWIVELARLNGQKWQTHTRLPISPGKDKSLPCTVVEREPWNADLQVPSASTGHLNAKGICTRHQQHLIQVGNQQCLPLTLLFKEKKFWSVFQGIFQLLNVKERIRRILKGCVAKSCGSVFAESPLQHKCYLQEGNSWSIVGWRITVGTSSLDFIKTSRDRQPQSQYLQWHWIA